MGFPSDSPSGHQDRDARLACKLRCDAHSVGHDRKLSARLQMTRDLERSRAGVQRDAVTVFDEARRLGSDERLLCPMKASPNFEGELRSTAAEIGRASCRERV